MRSCQSIMLARTVTLLLLLVALTPAAQGDTAALPRFTFAWPLDEKALKPRGATTRGAPVTLDASPNDA